MAKYTGYFSDLYASLSDSDIIKVTPAAHEVKEVYTDEDLKAQLRELLKDIRTLDQYSELVTCFEEIQASITLRFLYIAFDVLVEVEERVWESAGYHPPIREIFDKHSDLLLDRYKDFVEEYERDIIQWTKSTGIFDSTEGYDFIKYRNDVYVRYVVLAGKVLDADFDSASSDSTGAGT